MSKHEQSHLGSVLQMIKAKRSGLNKFLGSISTSERPPKINYWDRSDENQMKDHL